MKKHYTDENTGISYTLHGDYYLPDFVLPTDEEIHIGIWGQRHAAFLKEHKRKLSNEFLFSGRLNTYNQLFDTL